MAAAWSLTVPHPPGYPAYVWFMHLCVKAIALGAPFRTAAFVNMIFVLVAISLVLRACRSWMAVALVGAFATTPLVWRYAVLPDVFGLHLALTACLTTIAFESRSSWRTLGASLVFGLGAANHQSIVFLLPLLIAIAVAERSRPVAIGALALGASVALTLYASLLALDVESTSSWGHLRRASDVVHHFLRSSYGTLRLSGHDTSAELGDVLAAFAKEAGAFGLAAGALVALGCRSFREGWRAPERRHWWIVLGCLLLYIAVFFPRMNLALHPSQLAVRERFFLLPMMLMSVLATRVPVGAMRTPRIASWLTLALGLLICFQTAAADERLLSRDLVVEEYARNLLTLARSAGKPAIVLVASDTQVFSCHYIQAVEAGFEDVVVLSRGNMFAAETLAKIKRRWPAFRYDIDAVGSEDRRDVFRDFVLPNMDAFAIFHVLPVSTTLARTTILPLGRRVERGSGMQVGDASLPIIPTPPPYAVDRSEYVESKALFHDYAVYHLARGKALLASGDRDAAREAFAEGLALVPYCIPCLRNICILQNDEPTCVAALEELESNEYDYFK